MLNSLTIGLTHMRLAWDLPPMLEGQRQPGVILVSRESRFDFTTKMILNRQYNIAQSCYSYTY